MNISFVEPLCPILQKKEENSIKINSLFYAIYYEINFSIYCDHNHIMMFWNEEGT